MLMRIGKRLRGHGHFFCVIVPLILLMTYPTVIHVFDTTKFWVPTLHTDVWLKFWDAWHFKQVLAGNSHIHHTNLLFYPEGVSLTQQTYNLAHIILLNLLQLVMPPSNAYCLTYLLFVFICCSSGYIYCNWLFKDKWLALPGAVIFGLSHQVIATAAHPDLGFIATIPLTLYFTHRGIVEGRTKLLLVAGALIGFTVFCGMYIFVCNFLTVVIFVPLFAKSRWRVLTFWRGLIAMGMLAAIVGGGRILPMLADRADLDQAIQTLDHRDTGSDLMSYFFNHRHPVLTYLFNEITGSKHKDLPADKLVTFRGSIHIVYLGFATLALIGMGLLRKSSRRQMLPWLAIFACFLVLRLGSRLVILDTTYEDILLPKHYLNQLLPTVFAAIYHAPHFQIGVVLPLAVLACYGLRSVLTQKSQYRRKAIVTGLIVLIASELYFMPYDNEVPQAAFEPFQWLARQEDQESIALVPLPMLDLHNQYNFFNMLFQTIHGYPIAHGRVTRRPESTYAYINANALLDAGRRQHGIACGISRQNEVSAALKQLEGDGFSHVMLHRRQAGSAPFLASFTRIKPDFANRETFIYTLSTLRDHCDNPPPGTDSLALHLEWVFGDVMPPRDEPVLTFHPSERVNDDALRYLSWNNDFGKNLTHATVDAAGQFTLQSTNRNMRELDDLEGDQGVFLFLRHLDASAVEPSAAWDEWLAGHFQLCGRIAATEHIAVDQYLRRDMPCELVAAADKLAVVYDNGSELRNRVVEVESGDLWIALWWRLAEGPKTAYSIQVFDSAGERVRQTDHVLNRTMKSHALDVSDLPAGEYSARLIVYDFETGASQGGELLTDGTRFRRELEIARFELDG